MKKYFFLTKYIGLPWLITLIVTTLTIFLSRHDFSDKASWLEYLDYAGALLGYFLLIPFFIIVFDISFMLVYEFNRFANKKFLHKVYEHIKNNLNKWGLVMFVLGVLSFILSYLLKVAFLSLS